MSTDQYAVPNFDVYMGLMFSSLMVTVIYIVKYYAEEGFPWHTYITNVIGYYCAYGVLLLVPIDIATVLMDRRSNDIDPSSYNNNTHKIAKAYSVFFIITLIFNNVVQVFEEYFNTDGYFTPLGRFCNSFKRMLLDMALGVIAGVIVLGILLGQKVVPNDPSVLQLSAVIVTNTVYETVLMFLLAYGLVEYPRTLWQYSSLEYYLLRTQMKATADFKALNETQLNVSLAVSDVLKTRQEVNSYGDPHLTECCKILVADCPEGFNSSKVGTVAVNKSGQITVDTLAALRLRLNSLKDRYKMAESRLESTKLTAYYLEDVVDAMKREDGIKKIKWSLEGKDSTLAEYHWHVSYRPMLFKVGCFFCSLLSLFSFLGVVGSMDGVSFDVSVYYKATHDSKATPAGITLFIFITLGYTAYITYWSLFQVKMAGLLELQPHRTTPESLSFNVRMTANLSAPLAFFYLGWIAENGLSPGDWTNNKAGVFMPSSFSHFYQLQSVPIIKKTFGTLFPVILFVLCFLFFTNILNRILILVKLPNLQCGQEIVTDDELKEGKKQLARYKKSTERTVQREKMMTHVMNMRSGGDDGGMLGHLWGHGTKAGKKHRGEGSKPLLTEPLTLQSTIGKKVKTGIGKGWKDYFVVIKAPGEIHWYKDMNSADDDTPSINDANVSPIDLRSVMTFRVVTKPGKQDVYLDLEMIEVTHSLKFKSADDCKEWKTILAEWKDYAIDYAMQNPRSDGRLTEKDLEMGEDDDYKPSYTNNRSINTLADDLSAIETLAEDDEDDMGLHGHAKKTGGSGWFGAPPKKKGMTLELVSTKDEPPPMIEGWLEKKGSGAIHIGSEWSRKYCRINEEQGTFQYFKSSNEYEKPSGSIDLKSVKEITFYDKGESIDHSRFNINVDDKVFKFKAQSAADGERWVRALEEWREYFLLHHGYM